MTPPPIEQRRRKLPHWRVPGAWYFVTWSLVRGQRELDGPERTLVAETVRHFEAERYDLRAWVVMNDHVHVIVRPFPEWDLSKILHSWKSYTAHQLVKLGGRQAPVWLSESYERVVRGDSELVKFVRYIRHNPGRRWPGVQHYRWRWESGGFDGR